LKPVEQVKRVVELKPTSCSACGALLLGEGADAVRHQVTELPRVEPDVIEYRKHTLTCLVCGTPTAAEWPVDMPTGGFGPRAQATIGYFTGRMGMSQRDVEESMGAVFHTDVSLGSIPAHICSKIVRLDIYPYLQYHSRVGHTPHVWRFPWPGPGASALPASLYLQAQR